MFLSHSPFTNTLSKIITFQNLDKNVKFKGKIKVLPFSWLHGFLRVKFYSENENIGLKKKIGIVAT